MFNLENTIDGKVYHEYVGIIARGCLVMDAKSLTALELPKILERVAAHTAFSASRELALHLEPTTDLTEAQLRQQETGEACILLASHPDVSVQKTVVLPVWVLPIRAQVIHP